MDGNMQKMHTAKSTNPVTIYSLDVIISVGYRVASKQATMFRKWATQKLVQFATKGFVVDVERLKNPDSRVDFYRQPRAIIAARISRSRRARPWRRVRALTSQTISRRRAAFAPPRSPCSSDDATTGPRGRHKGRTEVRRSKASDRRRRLQLRPARDFGGQRRRALRIPTASPPATDRSERRAQPTAG